MNLKNPTEFELYSCSVCFRVSRIGVALRAGDASLCPFPDRVTLSLSPSIKGEAVENKLHHSNNTSNIN
jgi:hypothetical protein